MKRKVINIQQRYFHILILISVFAISKITCSISCDLGIYFQKPTSWTVQSKPYLLPKIDDIIYLPNDTIKNYIQQYQPAINIDIKTLLISNKIFKFGWRILNQRDCIAVITESPNGYSLSLPHNNVVMTSGECNLGIEYPIGFKSFFTYWSQYVKKDAADEPLSVIPCNNEYHWKNNIIYYDFISNMRTGTYDDTNMGGVNSISNTEVSFIQSSENTKRWINCELIAASASTLTNNENKDTLLNEDGIVNIIVDGIKAIDKNTGREYDTVALDIKRSRSLSTLGTFDTEYKTRDQTTILQDACPHANYDISVEVGALSPTVNNDPSTDDIENNDDHNDADIVISRNKWITMTVKDTAAPIISGIPTQPDFIPAHTECFKEALNYASNIIPRNYNKKLQVTDNCAINLPLPNYSWKFVNVEEDPDQTPPLTLQHKEFGCINRGSLVLSWSSTDGCGNNANIEQSIRVFDNKPPTLSLPMSLYPSDKKIKRCIDKLPSNRILCLDKIVDHILLNDNIIKDNCDPVEELTFNGLWKAKKIQKCKSAQITGKVGQAYLSCIAANTKHELDTSSQICIILQEHWLKVEYDVEIIDRCSNKLLITIDLLVAPTERICTNFGYNHVTLP